MGRYISVYDGQTLMGAVISTERGFEAYEADSGYIATYPAEAEARKAVREAFLARAAHAK